ncbi:MAG: Cys-Gln thioester bond-forming surface protein [Clostridia bacterium]|nr:Cys-Gln thioester bond-forming surface protein [Clostridia bacterium]
MRKAKNKILTTILLAIILITKILPIGMSFATNDIGQTMRVRSVGGVPYHLKSRATVTGGYVVTHLVGYEEGSTFYPAYCLNKEKSGAEIFEEGYEITLEEILKDSEKYNKVWRVITAGYPYNTPESLGVKDWSYAYQATKMAIYCVLGQSNVDDFYADENDIIGESVVRLIRELVNEGENGNRTYKTPIASITKSGRIKLEGQYYVQNYTIDSNCSISGYEISINNFPEGTKITDMQSVEKSGFRQDEIFQIRIPKEIVETRDIEGVINAKVETKSKAIFYATNYNTTLQDYAITGREIFITNAKENLNLYANTANIKIHKIDKDTKEPIPYTMYEIRKEDGTLVGNGMTDINGNFILSRQYPGKYIIKEVKSNDNYVISQESINIEAKYNQTTEITLENEHKKGNVNVYKVDKDNNKITLGNVRFDLYSEELNEIIGTYTTDVNGEIHIEKLRTGNYKLIEKETNKWYNLGEDTEVKIEWDETKEIVIENELKKGQIKVIKVDKDNNERRLAGVKFNILNDKGEILETIITNEQGEAETSKYVIRDYKSLTLQEVETQAYYKLNTEPQTIELQENQTKELVIENEKKKGQIRVIKVDADNKEIRLKDVEFDVYDESGNIVDKLITDQNGEATSKMLPIDQEYKIKETKTGDKYVLKDEPQTIKLEEDKITDITFSNEKKKGQIKVIKVDKDNNEIKLKGVIFNVYDEKGRIVDILRTNENGEATSRKLPIDKKYTVKELKTLQGYILNETPQTVILEKDKITELKIENQKVKGEIYINKTGKSEAKPKEEIIYNFDTLKNGSNIPLNNFTWTDNLPYKYIKIKKMYTGTYNEDINYVVKYKTNKSKGYIEYGTYNSKTNNCINFETIDLVEGEIITDFKIEYGTVQSGFEAIEKPYIVTEVLSSVKLNDKWTNNTKLSGSYKGIKLEAKSEWTTISSGEMKRLPKTGF